MMHLLDGLCCEERGGVGPLQHIRFNAIQTRQHVIERNFVVRVTANNPCNT